MSDEFVLVMITTPDDETAVKIAEELLAEGRIACASMLAPVRSLYTWQGALQREQEVLIVAKTRRALFDDRFIERVKSLHPYEVPEIVALPILAGSPEYLGWIREVTQ